MEVRESAGDNSKESNRATVSPPKFEGGLAWATVFFASEEDARKALSRLNHLTLGKTEVNIMFTRRYYGSRRWQFSATKNVFVKNIPDYMSSVFLTELFSSMFGDVENVRLMRDADNKPRGYGYVLFEEEKSAVAAVNHSDKEICFELEGTEQRCKFIIENYVPRSKRAIKWTNVYIRGFPPSWGDAELRAFGARFGDVQSAKVFLNEKLGKKYGFINFFDPVDAQKALERDGADEEADGRTHRLYIARAQTKEALLQLRDTLTRNGCNLYVEGLPPSITEAAIFNLFSPFGKIFSHALFMRPKRELNQRGTFPRAYVMFMNRLSAERAVADLHGRTNILGEEFATPLTVSVVRAHQSALGAALGKASAFPPPAAAPAPALGVQTRALAPVGSSPDYYQQTLGAEYAPAAPAAHEGDTREGLKETLIKLVIEVCKGIDVGGATPDAISTNLISILEESEILELSKDTELLKTYILEIAKDHE